MKIIVSVKQVPARDSALKVDSSGHWIDQNDLTFEMNEPDAYALEEALQLRDKLGGEVVVLSLGPESAAQTIREALAKGADRALHIQTEDNEPLDVLQIAGLIAEAVRKESPELLLTGLQSDDMGYGQTGVIVAELLGYAHATIVMEVEPVDGGVRVKRELEDGWYQQVTLPLPAVLTIQSGIKKLRYATLMGIKKAKTKPVETILVADLAANPAAFHLGDLQAPRRSKQTTVLSGNASDVARELVEKLRFEVRVI